MSDQKQELGPSDPLYYAPRWIRERNDPGDRMDPLPEADRKSRSAPAEGIPPPDAIPRLRHDRGRDPQHHKQPDIFAEAVARAERQLREPPFVDVPPHLQKRASIGIAAKFAVAVSVAILIALSFVIALPSSQGRGADNALAGLPTWQSLKTSLFAPTPHKPAPTLIVRDNSGLINEPLRLGIVVEDPAPGISVTIRRMPSDARLTAGKRIGLSEWRVPVRDIADAAIIPPADFVGGLILSAELRGADGTALVATFFGLTWTSPPPPRNLPASASASAAPAAAIVAAPPPPQAVAPPPPPAVTAAAPSTPVLPAATLPPADLPSSDLPSSDSPSAELATAGSPPAVSAPTAPPPAASPPAALPAPAMTTSPARAEPGPTPNEIAGFVRRAQELVASGDLPGARTYLTRAAEAHDARAALLLAKTFDPMVSRHLSGADQGPDVAQARDWYQKAREWGAPEAQRQLDALASYPRK